MNPLVVVGDALLDIDVEGNSQRLCPDAPVPVVDSGGEWLRPGGAGLAATLLATRSAPEVLLVTALGEDEPGRRLTALLAHDVQVLRMPLDGQTTCKTRIRAAGQSVVRVDTGGGRAAEAPVPSRVVQALATAGAILVSDYGHGVAAHRDLRRLLAALAPRVPIVWDPHPQGPAPVPGTMLVTPNETEAFGFTEGCSEPAEAAEQLRRDWSCSAAAVTIGARGAVLADSADRPPVTVPVPATATGADPRMDTCGAGDRFASAAAAALLDGASVPAAVRAAVDAASRFLMAGGASALSVDGVPDIAPAPTAFDLAARIHRQGARLVATGGCFDLVHPGHISLLQQARALGDALVVCVNSDDSVRRLKGPGRPVLPVADRVRLLEELESVDAVAVFDERSPAALLHRLRPDVWVKGGDYAGTDLPEAETVRRGGGEVVLVRPVDGYSTTRLLQGVHQ